MADLKHTGNILQRGMTLKAQNHHQQKGVEAILRKRKRSGITGTDFPFAVATPLSLTLDEPLDHLGAQHNIHQHFLTRGPHASQPLATVSAHRSKEAFFLKRALIL